MPRSSQRDASQVVRTVLPAALFCAQGVAVVAMLWVASQPWSGPTDRVVALGVTALLAVRLFGPTVAPRWAWPVVGAAGFVACLVSFSKTYGFVAVVGWTACWVGLGSCLLDGLLPRRARGEAEPF